MPKPKLLLHSFYDPDFDGGDGSLFGEEHHHCVQVLRHAAGDTIKILNGKGLMGRVQIKEVTKKSLNYEILENRELDPKGFSIHLFIAPTKNIDRMEWMVEKLGELHVDKITFIRTANSERSKIRLDRMERKVISAMKQSQSGWKTHFEDIIHFEDSLSAIDEKTLIAHVSREHPYISNELISGAEIKIFIGPEGDFTGEEVMKAQDMGAKAVSLGRSTLRTETAGLMACQAINFINQY